MKIGDAIVVTLAGFEVANATIEHIEDGKATLYIPATRVVLGVRQELTDLDYTPETDRILLDGVEENNSVPEAADKVESVTSTQDDSVGDGMSHVKLDSSAID